MGFSDEKGSPKTRLRLDQGLVKGAKPCFRNPFFYFRHGESTSTASQLTSPVSQKCKELNKVSLLLQDLGLDAQTGLTDTHTDISHQTQVCHSNMISMLLMLEGMHGLCKIETVMAILTQIVPCQNINAHKQTKN